MDYCGYTTSLIQYYFLNLNLDKSVNNTKFFIDGIVLKRMQEKDQSISQQLTLAALHFARQHKVSVVYLLTETGDGFFPRFGYCSILHSEVDPRHPTIPRMDDCLPDNHTGNDDYALRSLLHAQYGHIKNECRIGWDSWRATCCSIGQRWGQEQTACTASFHAYQALIPTRNDASLTKRRYGK